MNHKNNRRVQMTKKLLADSLLEMLKTEDIHKISIRALCEKADINRSTFYKYYGSQYDLLEEMINSLLSQIEETLNSKENHTFLDKLIILLTFAQENADFVQIMIRENIDPDFPKRLFSLPSIDKRLGIHCARSLQENSVYIQDFLFYGSYQVFKRWLNTDSPESPEELAEKIEMIFNKLLS